MAKNSSATQSVDVILFSFSPLFPDGLSGRDQPVELLNPPRVNHMPSSGKEENVLLNLVLFWGVQENSLQLCLASGRAECKCRVLEQSLLGLAHLCFPRLGEWDLGMEHSSPGNLAGG